MQFIEKNFWLPILISLFLGFLFPQFGRNLNSLIIPLIMIMFFLASLKIDFIDIVKHIKKPLFTMYLVAIYLLAIPLAIYWIFHFVNPELAIALLLLSATPPGGSTPALTDVFKGNVSLSMTTVLLCNLISPFTIIFLCYILIQKSVSLDLRSLFQTLIFINFLPLILAQIIRKLNKPLIEKTKQYYIVITVLCLCGLVYIPISLQAEEIIKNVFGNVINVLWLYVLYILHWFIGYFIAFWRNKSDKTATAIAKTYMNNGLAVGVAAAFFTPQILLISVLSNIPWSTTLGLFRYLLKYLK